MIVKVEVFGPIKMHVWSVKCLDSLMPESGTETTATMEIVRQVFVFRSHFWSYFLWRLPTRWASVCKEWLQVQRQRDSHRGLSTWSHCLQTLWKKWSHPWQAWYRWSWMCITLTSSTFCCQARHLNCFFFFKYRTLPSKRNELNTELSIPSRAGHRKADCYSIFLCIWDYKSI